MGHKLNYVFKNGEMGTGYYLLNDYANDNDDGKIVDETNIMRLPVRSLTRKESSTKSIPIYSNIRSSQSRSETMRTNTIAIDKCNSNYFCANILNYHQFIPTR